MNSESDWFEIWFSSGGATFPAWLLVVKPNSDSESEVLVLDPQEGYKVIFRGTNYEEACRWLGEDEFEMVDGRIAYGRKE
jgi:hypothetical protein